MKKLLSPEENEGYGQVANVSMDTPRHVPVLAYLLVAGAVLLLVAGFVAADNAITQTAFFAASAVVAILARIAQAGSQHEHLMDELRKR